MIPFTVITIGSRGAGKTLFLSSMFQQLLVQQKRTGFHLTIPDDEGEKRISLTQTFQALADPNIDWPPGTRDIQDWNFTCKVLSGVNDYPVFEFKYLDYAGGILTGLEEGLAEVISRVKTADAVLVLIDGHKVLNLMEGQSAQLDSDWRYILPVVQEAQMRTVHFAISKWDVLEDNYSLKAVRERLMENDMFRGVIEQRVSLDTPTRLIPVSSLGKGVARVGTNGQMEKIPGSGLHPKYVEMPLACTLIDAFESAQQEIRRERRKFRSRFKRIFAYLLKAVHLTGAASSALLTSPFPLAGPLVHAVLWEFVGIGMTRLVKVVEFSDIASKKSLKEEDEAITSAILGCNGLMMELERDEPYSNFKTI